jgi:hypothetical protein
MSTLPELVPDRQDRARIRGRGRRGHTNRPQAPAITVWHAACPLSCAMSLEKVPSVSSGAGDHADERRAKLRIDVLGQVEAHSVWRLRPLYLRELSETGFSLEATGPFEPEAVHKFRLGIEGHGRSIVIQAKARHSKLVSASRSLPIYVTGFEVVNASENATRELRSFVRFADSMWREEIAGYPNT